MTQKSRNVMWGIIVCAVVAAGAYVWLGRQRPADGQANPPPAAASPTPQPAAPSPAHNVPPVPALVAAAAPAPAVVPPTPAPAPAAEPDARPSFAPASAPAAAAAQPTLDANAAAAAFRHGMELAGADKLLDARNELSQAYFSGTLSPEQADQARAKLTELVEATLFSPRVFEGDPYTFQYTFQSGDLMDKVERKLTLHVPSQLILKINGIARASSIRAGQTVKMIQGPFHAVVSKSNFTMDLYLERPDLGKLFVKRLIVGLGKDGGTPAGNWKLRLGSKLRNAPWYPPATADVRVSLRPGDADYPLGKDGLWIGLVGTDATTSTADGYGIHGTNDPASIGKAASLGCIRLADADIEFVFNTLYEEWSTVQVLP